MNRTELTNLHKRTCDKAREIQVAKNHDYAHEGDIFRNFRRYGTFGVLVRLSDKLARLDSFEENKEFAVADEKLEDTIIDIINYATIYLAMKQEEKPTQKYPLIRVSPGKLGPLKVVEIPKVVEGPYCDCGELPKFRLAVPSVHDSERDIVSYYCSWCAECEPVSLVAQMTAMDKL